MPCARELSFAAGTRPGAGYAGMSDSGGVKLRSNYKTHFTLETVPTATILETELVALDRAQQAQERSEALRSALLSSPLAGSKLLCGDVMIYGRLDSFCRAPYESLRSLPSGISAKQHDKAVRRWTFSPHISVSASCSRQ